MELMNYWGVRHQIAAKLMEATRDGGVHYLWLFIDSDGNGEVVATHPAEPPKPWREGQLLFDLLYKADYSYASMWNWCCTVDFIAAYLGIETRALQYAAQSWAKERGYPDECLGYAYVIYDYIRAERPDMVAKLTVGYWDSIRGRFDEYNRKAEDIMDEMELE